VAEATQKQPSASAASLVSYARYLTVVAWCTTLAVVVAEATQKQPSASAASLVSYARYLTVVSWRTNAIVHIIKDVCLAGPVATTCELPIRVHYKTRLFGRPSSDDMRTSQLFHRPLFPKAVFRVLIWAIVAEKPRIEEERRLLR